MSQPAVSATSPKSPIGRALALSVAEGMLHALMVGLSESYLGALAVELGHGDWALALFATLPMLCGALSQLASGPLSSWLGSRKRLVVLGASLQAASHLALLVIATAGDRRVSTLLGAKILFWVSGSIIVPAWGAWMAGLTDRIHRTRYFGWRSALAQGTLLLAFAGGGALLRAEQIQGEALRGFGTLLTLAFLARMLSAFALAAQADPADGGEPPRPVTERTLRALRTAEWRTALYLGALFFGAFLSVPFFTPYMLRRLGLDLGAFAALTSVAILAKALAFPLWHRVADRVGLKALLVSSGMGVTVVPLVWSLTGSLPVLFAMQWVSGFVWAGIEYASFQLLLQSAEEDCRGEFLSLANSLQGVLQVLGAVAGGLLLEAQWLSYQEVFLTSAVLRGAALLVLAAWVRQLDLPRRLPRLLWRVVGVRPTSGAERRPALGPGALPDVDSSDTPPN